MAKKLLLVLFLGIMLSGGGCVMDEYYGRSYYSPSVYQRPAPASQINAGPSCDDGPTIEERLECWRRIESLHWQEYYKQEQLERSRGADRSLEVWKYRQRILYGK